MRGRFGLARSGRVASFSYDEGIGEVEDQDGERYFFHCTAISDGSREIPVGETCLFFLAPGPRGAIEARDIVKLAERSP